MKEATTTIRIPLELRKQLKTVADELGISMVQLIQKMLFNEVSVIFKPEVFNKLPKETQLRLNVQLAQTKATLEVLKEQKGD